MLYQSYHLFMAPYKEPFPHGSCPLFIYGYQKLCMYNIVRVPEMVASKLFFLQSLCINWIRYRLCMKCLHIRTGAAHLFEN
jgi:hypothetical protein